MSNIYFLRLDFDGFRKDKIRFVICKYRENKLKYVVRSPKKASYRVASYS